jgi:hypothetical protein
MISLAQHMNSRAYLTAEARACVIEASWLQCNQIKLVVPVEEPERVHFDSLTPLLGWLQR